MREVGGCDGERRLRLVKLGDEFRIVDFVENLTRGDVVASLDRTLGHSAVDPRRDIYPRRIRLSLDQERLGLGQIPQRQADNPDHDEERQYRGRSRRRAALRPFGLDRLR